MSNDIAIISLGFTARQLVRNIRRQNVAIPLALITANGMNEYNRPSLSHITSRGQRADDLTRQTAGKSAE